MYTQILIAAASQQSDFFPATLYFFCPTYFSLLRPPFYLFNPTFIIKGKRQANKKWKLEGRKPEQTPVYLAWLRCHHPRRAGIVEEPLRAAPFGPVAGHFWLSHKSVGRISVWGSGCLRDGNFNPSWLFVTSDKSVFLVVHLPGGDFPKTPPGNRISGGSWPRGKRRFFFKI